MLFISLLILGLIALTFAIALALHGLTSKEIERAQRLKILLGAAVLSIPGLLTDYVLFVFAVVLFQ